MLLVSALCLILLISGTLVRADAQSIEPKEVLVIHSYHSGLKWTDDIHAAILQEFARSSLPVNLQVEYLDAKRYGGREFEARIEALLKLKLSIRDYDAVLVSDDFAFQFVRERRDDLFAGIPIVFCGVNRFVPAMLEGLSDVTGVAESPDFAKTVELALKLHPETEEIVVINRTGFLTSRINNALLRRVVRHDRGRVRFSFWSDLYWDELQSRLPGLKSGQLVLLSDVIKDRRHGVLSYEECCRRVRSVCPVPLYGVWDFFLGQGIVGGKLVTGREQGRLAAGLVMRILAGERAATIPVIDRDLGRFMFDHKELQRFHISPKALPEQSLIINRPPSVYAISRANMFKVSLLFGGLTLAGLSLLQLLYLRYRAEKVLRENEVRFRAYFDINLVGMVAISAESEWLEVNEKYCEIVGYSRDELQRRTWRELVHADDLPEAEAMFQVLRSGGKDNASDDFRHVRKDGSIRNVQIWAKVLRLPDGAIDRVVVISQDITQRKQNESDLRLNEARLEALVALNRMGGAPVEETVNFIVSSAIGLTRSKIGYLAFVNDTERTLIKHGWTGGSLQECSLERNSLGYPIEHAGLWAEAVRHRKPIIINDYARAQLVKKGCPPGHVAVERFMGVPLLDKGEIVAVLGVGNKADNYDDTDIRQVRLLGQGLVRLMETRRSEQSLRKSKEEYKLLSRQFQTLLDGIPDALYLLTPERKIVWGNEAAARWAGLSVEELVNRPCRCLLDGRTEACPDCVVERCFGSGQPEEGTYFTRDERILGIKAFPLKNAAGAVQNVIEMAVDITEKVRLREEAARAGRLASLGQLAAGVAHEINNPNGVLMINARVLEDLFSEILPFLPDMLQNRGGKGPGEMDVSDISVEIPQLLADMQDSCRRIGRIVNDLKDFVRSEEKPSFERVDPNRIVQAAMRLSSNVIRKSTSRFESSMDPALPGIRGNFQQLEQVVINLIVNACQALQSTSDRIRITTRFDADRRCSVIEVSDEGKGIDPESLPRITEPFFTTKRQEGGTGLGLSVSARIVQEHRGKLEFTSQPGEGTTVRLALPSVLEEDKP